MTTTTTTPNNNNNNPSPPPEYNPNWKGYVYMLLASFINVMAISTIEGTTKKSGKDYNNQPFDSQQLGQLAFDDESSSTSYRKYHGQRGVPMSFGIIIFALCCTILIVDRLQLLQKNNNAESSFSYHKSHSGKIEGLTLVIVTVYSIIAVSYITQVNGIAYLALNIYFSTWLLPVSCIYTLNMWSTHHDILSIQELTSVSATLKSWYIVALASMVVTGTAFNMWIVLQQQQQYESGDNIIIVQNVYNDENHTTTTEYYGDDSTPLSSSTNDDTTRAAVLGMAFGIFSTILSCWLILTHYNLVDCCGMIEGGWIEFFCIVFMILLWTIGTSLLTQYNGIAATIIGTGCSSNGRSRTVVLHPPPAPTKLLDFDTVSAYMEQQYLLPDPAAMLNTSDWYNDDNYANITADNYTTDMYNNNSKTNATTTTNATVECVVHVQNNITYTCQDWWETVVVGAATSTPPPTMAPSPNNNNAIPRTTKQHNDVVIPGSNLYFAVWICLLGSLNLAFRWKAQQALQFAQAQQEKAFKKAAAAHQQQTTDDTKNISSTGGRRGTSENDEGSIDDDDDDLDDYDDANGY